MLNDRKWEDAWGEETYLQRAGGNGARKSIKAEKVEMLSPGIVSS